MSTKPRAPLGWVRAWRLACARRLTLLPQKLLFQHPMWREAHWAVPVLRFCSHMARAVKLVTGTSPFESAMVARAEELEETQLWPTWGVDVFDQQCVRRRCAPQAES